MKLFSRLFRSRRNTAASPSTIQGVLSPSSGELPAGTKLVPCYVYQFNDGASSQQPIAGTLRMIPDPFASNE